MDPHAELARSVYAGNKAATEQFVRVLSRKLGARQVTINAIAPGATDTEMTPEEVRTLAPSQTA